MQKGKEASIHKYTHRAHARTHTPPDHGVWQVAVCAVVNCTTRNCSLIYFSPILYKSDHETPFISQNTIFIFNEHDSNTITVISQISLTANGAHRHY